MADNTFEALLAAARARRLTRRQVLVRGAALGLSAPAIAALLAACGGSSKTATSAATTATAAPTTAGSGAASPASTTAATTAATTATPSATTSAATPAAATRGGAGAITILWWQAPVILNSHLSVAGKDVGAQRIVLEPLADFDKNARLVPVLAAEIPSVENGGVAKDGTSVTWKLRQGVKWHDGQPFTANDVAFTFAYLNDPATAATTRGFYQDVATVDAVDDYTAKVTFKHPTAPWFNPFTAIAGVILPQHILSDFVGAKAKSAPFNLKPIGTGPFKVTEFKPGDVVSYSLNPDYWDPGKPHFDSVTLKGGGDATSAARAVMQSGEADWAWNLQVEATVLKSLESAGRGKLVIWPGAGTEKMIINHSDPNTEVDGQKSSYKTEHPHFKVKEVRQAVNLAIDRDSMATQLYGATGKATGYTMNENPTYMPSGITWKYDLKAAADLLDKAGAQKGSDGIRSLNGRKLSWLYTASTNSLRQKEQEIIKQSLGQIGVDIEIKAVDASAYFDATNEASFQHLYCDIGMERNAAGVYPLLWYLRYLSVDPSRDIAQKENNWGGRNIQRYQNPQFNQMYQQVSQEIDPAKYTQMFKDMQTLVVEDVADIGLVSGNNVAAASNKLTGYDPSPYATDTWDIKNWTKA
ncbi:MAG TPA: peptide ABC transporter substrate-binding protein [Nitrolancea sp.]|nr:peptide ABC transporter substrate-binding protein [Nitrolancea sp.]